MDSRALSGRQRHGPDARSRRASKRSPSARVPFGRHKEAVAAPLLDYRSLKPLVGEMSVVEYDQLQAFDLLACAVHQLKERLYGMAVLVVERIKASFLIALGGIMRLTRLIEDQHRRNWATAFPKPPMEREIGQHMITDPVLTASHPIERDRAVKCIGDNRELLHIEP